MIIFIGWFLVGYDKTGEVGAHFSLVVFIGLFDDNFGVCNAMNLTTVFTYFIADFVIISVWRFGSSNMALGDPMPVKIATSWNLVMS